MSTWKVILATLVIFIAGLLTGTALLQKLGSGPFPRRGRPPIEGQMREAYIQRLAHDLELTPDQITQINKIMEESQQQMHVIFERVHNEIRAVLTADQQRVFDDMRRRGPGRPGEGPPGPRGRFRRPPSAFDSNRPAPAFPSSEQPPPLPQPEPPPPER